MFIKCSTRRNTWEKNNKSAKSSCSSCSLPTTKVTAEKENNYLAVGRYTQKTNHITISSRSLVKCSWKSFRYSITCSHSVAVSEKGRILSSHKAKFNSCRSRAIITYPVYLPGDAGRNGGKNESSGYNKRKKFTLANWLRLRENVAQTNKIPEGNVWKFWAFLKAFPRMIFRVRFAIYFVNAMLILTLSTSKLVIVLNWITGQKRSL